MLYFTRGGGPVAVAVYQFGDFRLDCGRFELLRNDRAVRLERKPMELLILLIASDGQLVTRTEIAGRLWSSEVFVDTEHGINTAIRKIRQALGDDPGKPPFCANCHRQGLPVFGAGFADFASREPTGTCSTPRVIPVTAKADLLVHRGGGLRDMCDRHHGLLSFPPSSA